MEKIKQFKKSDYDFTGWNSLLIQNGLKLSRVAVPATATLTYQAPVHLVDVNISGKSHVSRYSYMRGGNLNASIGAFCSFAQGIRIGDGNHPASWLSSNPIQYRASSFGFWPERADLKAELRLSAEIAKSQPTIGNDVWIGSDAIILRGVKIGDGAIIAAGSIVVKDVDPYMIVGGIPAKPIKARFSDSVIEKLLITKWWNRSLKDINGLPFDDPEKCLDILETRQTALADEPLRRLEHDKLVLLFNP